MADMHPSMKRLYAAAASLTPPITGQSALARAIGESPQNVKNWESRRTGVAKGAAARIQSALGISSTWILHGEEPMLLDGPSQVLTPDQSKLDAATRFFEQLEQSHSHLMVSDAARLRIITGVYVELLADSKPNWVEMTVRYSKMLEAA